MFKIFESSEGNVFKYVFTEEDYVAEAVLYRYEDFYKRTVICCSTMSGCPVGCKFCGTGNHFVRNLTDTEIVNQIKTILEDKGIEDISEKGNRFQIMFMSMGEPMLNWKNVENAIIRLHEDYPNAELLLSTIAPHTDAYYGDMIDLSKRIEKIGLQFSIHKSTDAERDILIPYKDKYNLSQIRDLGILWWKETGRHPYLNYCIDGTNNTETDSENLMRLFSPMVFNFTFSVVCSKNENMKEAGYRELESIRDFEKRFLQNGYNTRVFNPAGQDDIGGGCGQLWYVQKWLKEKGRQHMDIKEFAKSISGKEYGYPQFTKEEIETAKENGLVIVHGASDDLMEFEGAFRDEGGCFEGGKVFFDRNEVCQDSGEEKNYPNWINAVWDRDEDENGNMITWTYETEIPHETFMIYEDGELYCRGIVFSIDDVR